MGLTILTYILIAVVFFFTYKLLDHLWKKWHKPKAKPVRQADFIIEEKQQGLVPEKANVVHNVYQFK